MHRAGSWPALLASLRSSYRVLQTTYFFLAAFFLVAFLAFFAFFAFFAIGSSCEFSYQPRLLWPGGSTDVPYPRNKNQKLCQ